MKNKKTKNQKKKKEGIDILFLVLIIAVFILITSTLTKINNINPEEKNKNPDESDIILKYITKTQPLASGENNELDEKKIEELSKLDYSELKEKLDIEKDFCVYFEDENGNIIQIKDKITKIGSDDLLLEGTPCGE